MLLSQWGDLPYDELAPYMAIFYVEEADKARAFEIADMFFDATGIDSQVVIVRVLRSLAPFVIVRKALSYEH